MSLVTLATLGYGEITPLDPWLRIAAPLQAILGFVLFSAAITWLLSIYPAIGRQRALAREVRAHLRAAAGADEAPDAADADWTLEGLRVDGFARQLLEIHGDLDQFPTTYYFRTTDDRSALPLALEALRRIADDGPAPIRASRHRLGVALGDLCELLRDRYLDLPDGVDAANAIERYRDDHRHETSAWAEGSA